MWLSFSFRSRCTNCPRFILLAFARSSWSLGRIRSASSISAWQNRRSGSRQSATRFLSMKSTPSRRMKETTTAFWSSSLRSSTTACFGNSFASAFFVSVGCAHFESACDRVCLRSAELHEHLEELFRHEAPGCSLRRAERQRDDVALRLARSVLAICSPF